MKSINSSYYINGECISFDLHASGYNLSFILSYEKMSWVLSHVLSQCTLIKNKKDIYFNFKKSYLFRFCSGKTQIAFCYNHPIGDISFFLRLCENNKEHLYRYFRENLGIHAKECFCLVNNYPGNKHPDIGLFNIV